MNNLRPDLETMLPLSEAVLHILLALADGEKHGYGIMLEIGERTTQRVKMGPGTLYGAIKRLLKQGLIEEAGNRPDPDLDDERRRYYRLTEFGLRVTEAELARLASLLAQARAKQLTPRPETGG